MKFKDLKVGDILMLQDGYQYRVTDGPFLSKDGDAMYVNGFIMDLQLESDYFSNADTEVELIE